MLRRFIALAILLAIVAAGASFTPQGSPARERQQSRQPAAAERQQPAEVNNLIGYARAAPDEIAADGLIRIAESGLVNSPAQRRALIEEAFYRAANAQHPVRRTAVGGEVDSRAGYLSTAFDLRLDALTLRSRAVRAMLAVDKRRARELFSEMPPKLKLQPLDCGDALVYDVAFFYDTLKEIAADTFSPEEKGQGLHVQFVSLYVEGVVSPSQVWPVAELILSLKLPSLQLSALLSSFGKGLKNIAGDDRSFTHSLNRNSNVINAIKRLVLASKRAEVSSRELREEFRAYLVRNLRGVRCADNVAATRFIEAANKVLYLEPPIPVDDMKPLRVEGHVKNQSYWESKESRRLLSKIRKLRFGAGKKPLPDVEKGNPEWQAELSNFLTELGGWHVLAEKSEADYFHQKSVLYMTLLQTIPPGPKQEAVFESYLSFLLNGSMQRESRIEWFMHAQPLFKKLHSAEGEERAKIFERLNNSSNPSLQLHAGLTELLAKRQS